MQQHITQYRMKALCEALAVSRSSYRSWLCRPVNQCKLAFKEEVCGERFLTRHEAQQVIFEYIECHYHRIRRHSNNGWISPVNYEAEYYNSIEGMSVHLID